MMSDIRDVDSLIIGGGPGGLTAATYLARFRRSVTVVDAGESRLQLIPLSRNIPGFPDGVSGSYLQARMQAQARRYGAELLDGRATGCGWDGNVFTVQSTAGAFHARTVILATGVDVAPPDMADLDIAVSQGLIRYCPICDGFEAIGARIAVLGGRPKSIEEAHFLRTYSEHVTYVRLQSVGELSVDQTVRASRAGILVEDSPCAGLAIREDKLEVRLASGESRMFDAVYPCLGSSPRSALAEELGARLSDQAELTTDLHQATNVPGLYAVGDVLHGLDQVASACGQAAIAATAVHNRLRAIDNEHASRSLR